MEQCLIFSRETFYVTIVLCLHILWLKAVNEITARQTRTSLRKHDVIKLLHRIFDHANIISVANFQVLDRSQNYRIFNVRTILSSLWNIYHITTADFFDPPCICIVNRLRLTALVDGRRRVFAGTGFPVRRVQADHSTSAVQTQKNALAHAYK